MMRLVLLAQIIATFVMILCLIAVGVDGSAYPGLLIVAVFSNFIIQPFAFYVANALLGKKA